MGAVVESIRAEITRAKQHIQDLQLGLRAFYDTKPNAFAIKEDTQAGKRIYYVSKAEAVPYHVAAIAADVIQNLRSPLDQIAYQLVLDACGGAEPKWKVYYPIAGNAASYPSTRGRVIKGVGQAVINAIDATEPYKGGKGHALWQLNALNKVNKHKLLVGTGAFYGSFDITPDLLKGMPGLQDISFPPISLRPADPLLALKVGDPLFMEPIEREVTKNRRFTYDVSFNQPGIIECEPVLKTLQDMTNLVDAIVISLGQFLP